MRKTKSDNRAVALDPAGDALRTLWSLGTKDVVDRVLTRTLDTYQAPGHTRSSGVKATHQFLTRETTLRKRDGRLHEVLARTCAASDPSQLSWLRATGVNLLGDGGERTLADVVQREGALGAQEKPPQSRSTSPRRPRARTTRSNPPSAGRT